MSKVHGNIVTLDRGNYTTCAIHLHGGTISSYRVKNKEMLYLKEQTSFNKFSRISGGIKYSFPYYGRSLNGPTHGFPRYVPWKLEAGPTILDNNDVEAVFVVEQTEYVKAMWNYRFKLTFKVKLCLNSLVLGITVENTSLHFPFLFTILRQSIFRVDDVRKVEVFGLSKCKFCSLSSKSREPIDPDPNEEKIIINRSFTNVYLNAPQVIEVHNVDKTGLKLRITCCDTASPDVLLYNPWRENNDDLEDSQHNSDEYLNCLGVGNGYLHADKRLEPKQTWQSQQIIEVIDEKYNKKVDDFVMSLSNPWESFEGKCSIKNTY